MIDGHVDKRIIDGEVWVKFDDIIQAMYVVASQALDVAELTGNKTLVVQTQGIIDVAKGLDEILDKFKRLNGLALYR